MITLHNTVVGPIAVRLIERPGDRYAVLCEYGGAMGISPVRQRNHDAAVAAYLRVVMRAEAETGAVPVL